MSLWVSLENGIVFYTEFAYELNISSSMVHMTNSIKTLIALITCIMFFVTRSIQKEYSQLTTT